MSVRFEEMSIYKNCDESIDIDIDSTSSHSCDSSEQSEYDYICDAESTIVLVDTT